MAIRSRSAPTTADLIAEAEASRSPDERRRTIDAILAKLAKVENSDEIKLLRSLPMLGVDRLERAELSVRVSSMDPTFCAAVHRGDKGRDQRAWHEGINGYREALSSFPLHAGYRVQYGHCLKELEQWTEAEIAYRDALAHGAPISDVLEHLEFVFFRSGARYKSALSREIATKLIAGDSSAMLLNSLTDSSDVKSITRLFWGTSVGDSLRILGYLRSAPVLSRLLEEVISNSAFIDHNQALLAMLARRPQVLS